MNWLSQEKIFTYFYNKFRPVNRIHYIKYGVNSSLHNSGCCRRSVAPWITTQYSQLGWFTNLLWCDILRNKAPCTGPHHVWCIYTLCPFSGPEKNTDNSAAGWMILLASVCYGDSRVAKHFWFWVGVSNQNFTGGVLLEFDFFPGHCNRHLQWSPLFTLLCMTRQSCSNLMPLRFEHHLQWQQNRSKAMMWLLYKIPAIRGCPRCF